MIDREKWAEARRLFYGEHWKIETIATQLNMHHDTVRRAIDAERFVSNSIVPWETPPAHSIPSW